MNIVRFFVYLSLLVLVGPVFANTSMGVAETHHSRIIKFGDNQIDQKFSPANVGNGLYGWNEQYSERVVTRVGFISLKDKGNTIESLASASPTLTGEASKKRENIKLNISEYRLNIVTTMTPNAKLSDVPNTVLRLKKRVTLISETIKVAPKMSDKVASSWSPATPNSKVVATPNMIR
mgnify:CR=1 FL=1